MEIGYVVLDHRHELRGPAGIPTTVYQVWHTNGSFLEAGKTLCAYFAQTMLVNKDQARTRTSTSELRLL